MNYKKGKLLRRKEGILDEKIAGKDVLRTEEKFRGICKTCNRPDSDTTITRVCLKFACGGKK